MDAEDGSDILGAKKLNYEFLMLVRDKKYPEALAIGKKILQVQPDNPSVKKFCDFILSHDKELQKMVKQEQEYEEVGSDESEQEQGEEEQEGEDKEKQGEQKSQSDEKEDEEDEQDDEQQEEEQPKQEKPKPKIQLKTCTLNQIPHICTRDHN